MEGLVRSAGKDPADDLRPDLDGTPNPRTIPLDLAPASSARRRDVMPNKTSSDGMPRP